MARAKTWHLRSPSGASADWNDETVKAYLAGMLSDLVPESGIVIAGT